MEKFIARPQTGVYRYLLHHRVTENFMAPVVVVCLLNPAGNDLPAFLMSSACRGVERLARYRGWCSVAYVNLFPRIAKTPADLWAYAQEQIIGPDDDAAILEAVHEADFVVVGFGSPTNRLYERRARQVYELLKVKDVFAVGGLNADGWPRHPSARPGWRADDPLTPWTPPGQD